MTKKNEEQEEVVRPPETKQERLEEIIVALWPKLYTGSWNYASQTIMKAIDLQTKVGGTPMNDDRVMIGLPELEDE